ncbi:hypothetical protein B0I37DRAFT_204953 [Chaetomium sp. MPI-CAGE-AT-0009]|nr:hypothetical protein B0I37DRAFT_204953 [Chaetomium sp. MPI-CAGE-AT-0009]
MGWALSQWVAFVRATQLLGALAVVGSHGYLTVRVKDSTHGLTKEIIVLELMACLVLGYSILALVVQQTGRRSKQTGWLIASVVFDVVLVAVLLGIISVLGRGGLPMHCGGLTRVDDPPEPPLSDYYTTVGFSDKGPGHRGELDELCKFEHPYFAIANILVFTYMFTVTATVIRILEQKYYTRNTKVNELLESLERAEDINLKLMDSPSPQNESPRLNLPPPPSEGILTRNTSLRSTFTAATSVAASHSDAHGRPSIPRRPIGQTPPLPRRAISPTSPAPSGSANTGVGFVPVPLDDDDSAEAALVADGMRHQPPPHHHHQRNPSRDAQQPAQFSRMPMLSEEDQSADHALVSDGMRPGDHTLPPYHPGNRRMSGHGGDNEMRLSGYVKGQTRAQDMKDSGRY